MPLLIEEYLLDAVAIVSASAVSDEDFAGAINEQAKLLAGMSPYEHWDDDTEQPIQ
ncbi:MAG: hypothetical protein JSU59_05320 [Nitrospirota bacterium]|nr:MAG: hypothetical protein JSU59_05320 [Nitrospirota bacterium]